MSAKLQEKEPASLGLELKPAAFVTRPDARVRLRVRFAL